MYFYYIDESGSTHPHSIPIENGQTPVFTLSSLAVHEQTWRELDRQYLYLKREFFPKEIGTKRAEYHEVKGNYLISPAHRDSKRNAEFLRRVLRLCDSLGVKAFSISFLKNHENPASAKSMYSLALQYLVERLHLHLETSPGENQGLIIVDERSRELDRDVAQSHLSFLFGNPTGRTFYMMVEAPLFADSKLTAGIQIADIVGACLYANTIRQKCGEVDGAPDYSGIAKFWPMLDKLQFRGPPLNPSFSTTYGYRIINHQPTAQP